MLQISQKKIQVSNEKVKGVRQERISHKDFKWKDLDFSWMFKNMFRALESVLKWIYFRQAIAWSSCIFYSTLFFIISPWVIIVWVMFQIWCWTNTPSRKEEPICFLAIKRIRFLKIWQSIWSMAIMLRFAFFILWREITCNTKCII